MKYSSAVPNETRRITCYSLSPRAVAAVRAVADSMGTSASSVVEALILQAHGKPVDGDRQSVLRSK
jgi:hypothetical protein